MANNGRNGGMPEPDQDDYADEDLYRRDAAEFELYGLLDQVTPRTRALISTAVDEGRIFGAKYCKSGSSYVNNDPPESYVGCVIGQAARAEGVSVDRIFAKTDSTANLEYYVSDVRDGSTPVNDPVLFTIRYWLDRYESLSSTI